MADYPNANGITYWQLRSDLFALYKQLVTEKSACWLCQRGARCKEPHAKPYKTLAWASGIRQSTIEQEVAAAYDEIKNEKKDFMREHTEQVLRNLAWCEAEVQAAWERSKLPSTQTTTETITSGPWIESGATTVRDRRTRGQKILREQTGEAAYMSTYLAVQRQRREIFGLDAPKKIIPLNPDGSGLFDGLLRTLAQGAASQIIEVTPEHVALEYHGTHAGNGRDAVASEPPEAPADGT